MARFYVHYQNSTVSGLEVLDEDNCYERKTVSNTANAATARTSMLSARSTLSASFYSTIDAANRNGASGVVVPLDGYTNDGATVSNANIYTNAQAIWPSDPRVRPTTQILVNNSTVVVPSDSFSVPTSEYNAARNAVGDFWTASVNSPYSRLGIDPWRTLASVWHDHDLNYFAWDDFTPSQMANFAVAIESGVGEPEKLRFTGDYSFLNDENPDGRVELIASLVGPTTYNLNVLVAPTAGSFTYDWEPAGVASVTAGTYALTASVRLRDAVITTHFGRISELTDSFTFPI